jgi:O-antigen/teichoic acid export membrane protein
VAPAAFASRTIWSLTDQALSSTTNFGITILIARSFSPSALGSFALAYAYYIALLQLSRCFTSEPLTVRFSGSRQDAWHGATLHAASTALTLGCLGTAAGLAVASLTDGALRSSFLVVSMFLPLLLLQDLWRFGFFAAARPRAAAANDAVWVVAMAVFVLAAHAAGSSTLTWLVFAWAFSGALAGVFGVLQVRARPRAGNIRGWIATHRDLGVRFAGEFLVYSASVQATLYIVGAVAGVAAVGSIRAAQTLVGPVSLVFLGVSFGAVPEGVRIATRSPERLPRFASTVSVCLAGVSLMWGAVLLALPDGLGQAILGDSWRSARNLMFPIVVAIIAEGLNVGPWMGLRALAAAGRSLRSRTMIAAVTMVAGAAGATTMGAWGAAAGFAVGSVVATGVWTWQFLAANAVHNRMSRGLDARSTKRPDVTLPGAVD